MYIGQSQIQKSCQGQFCTLTNNIQLVWDESYLYSIKTLSSSCKKYYHNLYYSLAFTLTKEIVDNSDTIGNDVYTAGIGEHPYVQTCKDCNYRNIIAESLFKSLFLNTVHCPGCKGLNVVITTLSHEQGDYTHLNQYPRPYSPLLMNKINNKYNNYINFVKYIWEFEDFQLIPTTDLENWIIVDFK